MLKNPQCINRHRLLVINVLYWWDTRAEHHQKGQPLSFKDCIMITSSRKICPNINADSNWSSCETRSSSILSQGCNICWRMYRWTNRWTVSSHAFLFNKLNDDRHAYTCQTIHVKMFVCSCSSADLCDTDVSHENDVTWTGICIW